VGAVRISEYSHDIFGCVSDDQIHIEEGDAWGDGHGFDKGESVPGREEALGMDSGERIHHSEDGSGDGPREPQSDEDALIVDPDLKSRRRVLIVSYYFPPTGLSNVLRIAKFAKYLPAFGWDPTVLTVGDIGTTNYDYSLLEEVLEAGTRVERTKTIDPARLLNRKLAKKLSMERYRGFLRGVSHTFLQPDNKIGWKRYALARAMELVEEEEYDMVLATAPPFTDFVIGLELQKQRGLPLVVDYRDPWLDNRNYFYATPIHRTYAAGLEENVLKNADAVVVVNRRIKERLIARYPFLTHDTVHIIPSGYDPRDMQIARRYPLGRPPKFRLTYSGSFDLRHTPKYFFSALAKIFAKHPETRDEIEASFIGEFPEVFRKMALNVGVSSALVTTGYLEHAQVARYLLSSDLLWLATYDPLGTPGKVYEYMGSGKPILALAEQGALRQTLSGYGAATCVDPTDTEAIASAIFEHYLLWKEGRSPEGNRAAANDYDQRLLTGQLSRILAYALKI